MPPLHEGGAKALPDRAREPIIWSNGLGCRSSRLRSNPSNLSGSCQRREPPMATVHRRSNETPTVLIIGAGVIGLGLPWRIGRRGAAVAVFDRAGAGAGARHAAAGMLAACAEAEPGEENLIALGRRSQALWPDFAAELEGLTGHSVDLRREGTLVVALTADDQARLQHHLEFQQSLELPVEWISAREARRREPHLASLAGAVWSPEDGQVDNRKVVAALKLACASAGAQIQEHRPVQRIVITNGRAVGVELADGSEHRADVVVRAAGRGCRGSRALRSAVRPPARPAKGQMIAFQTDAAAPPRT